MSEFNFEAHNLKKLLCEAYECGWHGSKELKESAIETLMSRAEELTTKISRKEFSLPSQPEPLLWGDDTEHWDLVGDE